MRKKLLLSFFVAIFSFTATIAQNITVTGKVTDDKNVPIEGAVVTEKAQTNNRTITDASGTYRISVKAGSIITVTSVGFESKQATAQSTTNFTLKALREELTEVVVTALGIKKEKKALGYAVSTIGKKDLELKPEIDVARILNGKAPGVNILNTSGLAGSGTNVIIRGLSTISGNAQPLWVLDGVPIDGGTNQQTSFVYGNNAPSRFLDLDVNNIESIDILKGLSATVLYGEGGSNGVILVTTKNQSSGAVRGKSSVTVAQTYSVNQFANLPEYNTSYGGGFDLSLGLAFYSNWGAKFTDPPTEVQHPYDRAALHAAFPEFKGAKYPYKFYNSVPRFFRDGSTKNTSVNFKGGSKDVSYNVNFGYTDDQGFVTGNGVIKSNIGMGGTAKLSNKITISGSLNNSNTNVNSPPTSPSGGSGSSAPSLYGDVMYTPTAVDLIGLPWENPIDRSHVYYRANNGMQNPTWTLHNAFNQDKTSRTIGNVRAKYDINKDFFLSYTYGFDNYTNDQMYAQNKGGSYYPRGFLRTSTAYNSTLNHEINASYSNIAITNDINLDILGGVVSKEVLFKQFGVKSEEQLVFGLLDHSNFVTHDIVNEGGGDMDYQSQQQTLAAYAQGVFDYKKYVYLTLSGRNSWSSTLEAENRSILYPSANVSFIPTEAFTFLQNKKNINYLKLSGSYATSARFPGPYRTRAALDLSTRRFQTVAGTILNSNSISNFLPNSALKAELLKEAEFGIEAKLFQSRLSLDVHYYNRTAQDQILTSLLDPSTGFTAQQINAGDVNNKGFEVQIAYKIIRNKDWLWEVTANWTRNRSMVSNIPTELKEINYAGYSSPGNYAINGMPMGVIKAYGFKRDANGVRIVNSGGDYIYTDDLVIVGDPNANYQLTGISSLTYKGFSFRMQVNYTDGGDIYSGTTRALLARGVTKDTEFDRAAPYILPGVKEDGSVNNQQVSATQAYFNNMFGPDESGMFDATVVRISDMSLSYALPEKMLSKTPFGSLTVSANGSNLWYYAPNFPKYVNFDPEVSSLGVSSGKGLEFINGPSARRMGVSLRVTF